MNLSPSIWILAGPTASGKSRLALNIARKINGTIFNADSIQVYKDLRILSARPSPDEEKQVPHYGYGFLNAHENYSAGAWLQLFEDHLNTFQRDSGTLLIVGGTGLYLKALTEGLSEIPQVDPSIRPMLGKRIQREGPLSVYNELMEKDALSASRISPYDTHRLARAMEVLQGTGRPLSFWQERSKVKKNIKYKTLVLLPDRSALKLRAAQRIHHMVGEGAIDEVQNLMDKNIPLSAPVFRALGAQEFYHYLDGKLTLDAAIELTRIKTCQYIKRQYTWFRHQLSADYVFEEIENEALMKSAMKKLFPVNH